MMIRIKRNPMADTRTCDWSKVTRDQLLDASQQHIFDVQRGMWLFAVELICAANNHDADKLTNIDGFHADFVTGFKNTAWWDNHRKISRHHLTAEDGVPEDVNLVDVIEHVVDCVMAGMARSGSVYELRLSNELLQRALENTVELLKNKVQVE